MKSYSEVLLKMSSKLSMYGQKYWIQTNRQLILTAEVLLRLYFSELQLYCSPFFFWDPVYLAVVVMISDSLLVLADLTFKGFGPEIKY